MIRHCVEETNVDENMNVIDATEVRHVTVKAGKIELMSGIIDPASHLNLDHPDHRVTVCIIAESFKVGAKVKMDNDGLLFATVQRSSYDHFGQIDYTQRLLEMIKVVKQKQQTSKEITAIKTDSSDGRQHDHN